MESPSCSTPATSATSPALPSQDSAERVTEMIFAPFLFSVSTVAFSSMVSPLLEIAITTSPGRDVVIAISNSGETMELKATVETLKKNGAKIIALTGKPESWLAKAGDVALIAGVAQEGDSMNKPPRASILVEIMMLQCLSILLQNEKHLDPKQYVKWHPGGSLGKSIREGEK